MKFFAALKAKLSGTAEAPRTLDQARATHAEANSALDKIAALFTAASLDLDAMLTAGDNALKEYVAKLNAKADEQAALTVAAHDKFTNEAALREKAAADLATAQEKLSALSAQHSALASALGLKLETLEAMKPEEAAKAVQAAYAAHIGTGVAQKLGELGIPAAQLPKPDNKSTGENYDDILAAAASEPDLAKRSALIAKANRLRAQLISPAKN